MKGGKCVYPTLNAEMARRSINKRKLAQSTGINYTTLVSKLNGKGVLTLPDMRKIKDVIGTNIPMEELFEEDRWARDFAASLLTK